jgi:hypothetical protein
MSLIGPTLETLKSKIATHNSLFRPNKNKAQVTLGLNALRNANNGKEIDRLLFMVNFDFPAKSRKLHSGITRV